MNDVRGEFGVFQNSSFVRSDFGCLGEEDRLLDCPFGRQFERIRTPSSEAVGVICRG